MSYVKVKKNSPFSAKIILKQQGVLAREKVILGLFSKKY